MFRFFGLDKYNLSLVEVNLVRVPGIRYNFGIVTIPSPDIFYPNCYFGSFVSEFTSRSTSLNAVLPKHTLFKVLYFIFAKCKNYTLFILFFSQIL